MAEVVALNSTDAIETQPPPIRSLIALVGGMQIHEAEEPPVEAVEPESSGSEAVADVAEVIAGSPRISKLAQIIDMSERYRQVVHGHRALRAKLKTEPNVALEIDPPPGISSVASRDHANTFAAGIGITEVDIVQTLARQRPSIDASLVGGLSDVALEKPQGSVKVFGLIQSDDGINPREDALATLEVTSRSSGFPSLKYLSGDHGRVNVPMYGQDHTPNPSSISQSQSAADAQTIPNADQHANRSVEFPTLQFNNIVESRSSPAVRPPRETIVHNVLPRH